MPVVMIANPKGGVGKSTLSTHVAGYFASQGRSVMLGDVDRQQSSALWLKLRPPTAPLISTWEISSHMVLDTPAGLHGKRLKEVLKIATKVLVPLQPSIFDIYATRAFLDELVASRHAAKLEIGLVGMRTDARTIAAEKLHEFIQSTGLPIVGYLRDTQNYVHLAARGLTLFDVARSRVEKDLQQWQPICDWLKR